MCLQSQMVIWDWWMGCKILNAEVYIKENHLTKIQPLNMDLKIHYYLASFSISRLNSSPNVPSPLPPYLCSSCLELSMLQMCFLPALDDIISARSQLVAISSRTRSLNLLVNTQYPLK